MSLELVAILFQVVDVQVDIFMIKDIQMLFAEGHKSHHIKMPQKHWAMLIYTYIKNIVFVTILN